MIVEADAGAAVHLGPGTALDAQTLQRWVAEQDPEAMLAALREVPVRIAAQMRKAPRARPRGAPAR